MASILPDYPHVAVAINDFSEVISAASASVVGYVLESERGSVYKRLNIPSTTARDLYLGKPNLRYGYGMHCLTAGLVTSNTNTVVRVVDKDTAKFGGLKFDAAGYTATQYSVTEVLGSPINAYADEPFATDPFAGDASSFLIIRAENPNEVDYRIRVYDCTQTPVSASVASITAEQKEETEDYTVTVVTREAHGLETGDKVIMSLVVSEGRSDLGYDGTWVITKEDDTTFTYTLPGSVALLSARPNSGRWVKYPPFDQQSFGIDVYEVVDGVALKTESFTGLTMYPATNSLNENTFVEEVVNVRSNTIRVWVKKTGTEGVYEYPTSNPAFTDVIELPKGACGNRCSTATIAQGWQLFNDPTQSTVNILVNCGYVSENDMTVQRAMLDIAQKRRDCFCIFDAPKSVLEASPDPKLLDWRRNMQAMDSYDFAQYSNWVKVTDTFTGSRNVWLPMSGFAAQVYSRNDVARGIAAAPAGMDVGQLEGSELVVTGLSHLYDEASQESIYGSQINYAKLVPGSGYYLWGNKTGQTRDSALSMIGAVRVIKQIETALKLAQEYNLFKQNTAFLRLQIEQTIEDYLNTFVTSGQIASGSCVCDDTNNPPEVINQRQLNIWVFVQPLYAAEKIFLQTNVLKSGQNINSVISAIPL